MSHIAEGMMMDNGGSYNLRPIHDLLLRIYGVIEEICNRHHIRFYTSGGTTLGAVRHHGFIPWDDDLDLSMPRPDLERFVKIIESELPDWLGFLSWRNCPCYTNMFSKVIVTDPEIVLETVSKSGIPAPGGFSIDIFPIDGYPRWRCLIWLRIMLMGLCKWALYKFNYVKAYAWIEWFSARFNFDKAGRVIDWAGWLKQEIKFSKQDRTLWMTPKTYGEGRDVPFGDGHVRVPDIPEQYLGQIYGDWTRLPEEKDRHPTHVTDDCEVESWRFGPKKTTLTPLLSIVVANYNYGRFIGEALSSVIDQCVGIVKGAEGQTLLKTSSGETVELVVCDGGSTDNSVEEIKKFENSLAWWCSEKDRGQSDAFNKGFKHSTGRYLTWLNADDLLVPGFLDRFVRFARKNITCEWFTCGSIWVNAQMKIDRLTLARHVPACVARTGYVPVYGPSSFFSRRLLNAVGGVNVEFHYKMDTLMWLQFYHNLGVRSLPIPGYAYVLRMHEQSKVSGLDYYGRETPPQMKWETAYLNDRWPKKPTPKFRQLLATDAYKLLINFILTRYYKAKDYRLVKNSFA